MYKTFKIYRILVSAILVSSIYYISLDQNVWNIFWGSLSIPPQIPFSDLKAHLHFFNCFDSGVDIYINECNLIPDGNAKISTHPQIWLYLVKYLNLNNTTILNCIIGVVYFTYFYIILEIFSSYKSFHEKIFITIFFFSTTNFILIERFATDIVIFIIVFLILNTKFKFLQVFLIFLGTILKYYPVFLIAIYPKHKLFLSTLSLFFLFFFYFFYFEQIILLSKNMLEVALLIAYGVKSFTKSFYHLSLEYDLLINNKNYFFFKNFSIVLFFLYTLTLFFIGYKKKVKEINKLSNRFELYFLAGSSIYIGTFIIGSNFDYRLIFLIFTIPYILNLDNNNLKFLVIVSYSISINSFIFQSYIFPSEIVSWTYYIKSIIVFACKFLILTVFSFLLGTYFKKINFFKFRK